MSQVVNVLIGEKNRTQLTSRRMLSVLRNWRTKLDTKDLIFINENVAQKYLYNTQHFTYIDAQLLNTHTYKIHSFNITLYFTHNIYIYIYTHNIYIYIYTHTYGRTPLTHSHFSSHTTPRD